jgi:outer membrane receptor protein involved in Fe transport
LAAELLIIAAAIAAPPSADAPKRDAEATIVVTGERAKRTLRDTPSSVAVVGRAEIEAAAADRVDDVLALIPNVQLGSGSDGPAVRGQDTTGVLHDLPAFLGGNRPRMTLQVDGRAVTYNEFAYGAAPLWDVKRIEVFRSPQTTTQGRNSIAGAIFVETEDPAWDWQGAARAIAGNYDTRQLSAMVSGPISDDELALRVTGDARHSRVTSLIGRNANGGPDPNDDDYAQVRVKLLAQPKFAPGARLLLTYAHSASHAPQTVATDPPFRQRRDPGATYGIFRLNVDSLTARGSYAPSAKLGVDAVVSAGDAHVRRFAPRGFGETRLHSRDLSGEIVGRWTPAPWVDVLAGASAVRTRLEQAIDISATPFGTGVFEDVQKSWGLFGQATVNPLARVKLTGGARYQRDRQDRDGLLAARRGPVPLHYHQSFHAFLPKLSIEYAASDSVSVGALVERAYNPGGTTIDLRLAQPDTFKAETLWDYELFARAAVPDTGLTLTANLFYYDMHNTQRPQERQIFAPGSPGPVTFLEIDNAPRARTYGMEAEARWRPSERLTLQAGLGLLSTKVTRTLEPDDPLLCKSFQRAPKLTAMAAVDWRPVKRLRLSAQLRHNSGYFSDDTETTELKVGPATTLNARAALELGKVNVFAYARNVTNEFHLVYLFDPASAVAADPREVGIGLEARF